MKNLRKKIDSLKLQAIVFVSIGFTIWEIGCQISTPTSVVTSDIVWERTNGPYGGDVYSIAVNSEGVIFAGGFGIYRSMDNGSHWTYLDMKGARVYSLFIDPFTGYIYAMTKDGTLRSTDGAGSWSKLRINNLSDNFTCFVLKPDGCIFAGRGNSVYRSTDGGESWTDIYIYTSVKALAIHPNGYIYAGTHDGVYLSTDNGENWEHIGLETRVNSLAISSNGHIFAGTNEGIYHSIDNGENWTFFDFDTPVRKLAINSNGIIFAKTNSGLFRSMDNGESWSQIEFAGWVNSFVIDSNDELFIAGRGVFRSTDNGENWTALNINIFNSVDHLAANYLGHVFAVASDNLYRTRDRGTNWELITSLNPRVFSVGINARDVVFASTENGVFRSTDNGNSWVQADHGLESRGVYSFAFNASGHVFAGISLTCLSLGGIYRSTNNGNHWTRLSPVEYVNSIEIVTKEYFLGNRLVPFEQIFVVTEQGIITSADNGDSWTGLNTKKFNWIGCMDSNPEGHLFISAENGIYRSTDYGKSWNLVCAEDYVQLIAINTKGHIYAKTYTGLIRSTNNFKGWRYVNSGLGNYRVESIAFGANGHTFVGTRGGGVFRSSGD